MASLDDVPNRDALLIAVLKALKGSGGSASNEQLVEKVAKDLGLPDDIREVRSAKVKGPSSSREARRDGAPAIDHIDGESLCALLKQLKL